MSYLLVMALNVLAMSFFATSRHIQFRRLYGKEPGANQRRWMLIGAWCLLAVALLSAWVWQGAAYAVLIWLGTMTAAALIVLVTLQASPGKFRYLQFGALVVCIVSGLYLN